LVAAPAPASPLAGVRSCVHGYSYAGYAGHEGTAAVGATIAAVRRPAIQTGHAAAWVGVGGVHAGPGGKSEWLQTGLAAFPRTGLRLYVESVSRGLPRQFVDLGPAPVGRRYRFSVRETGADVWQAFVNGSAVGRPAYLPTATGSWRPIVTAESWAAGRSSCNRYGYAFEGLSVGLARSAPIGQPRPSGRAAFSAAA
jgi:hypothetical protein